MRQPSAGAAPAQVGDDAAHWPGLSGEEALRRLVAVGQNQVAREGRRGPFAIFVSVVREPMFLLLLGASGLYLIFGDWREGVTLLAFVLLVITLTLVQEGRAEHALDALGKLASPHARVRRDGVEQTIPAETLVPGDLIRLCEGDRVPADAVVRAGTTLVVDESLLTGESVAVEKNPAAGDSALFAGTLIVSGQGVAEVHLTGPRSALGRIGASLAGLARGRSLLQKEVSTAVRVMAVTSLGVALALVLARALTGTPWLQAALAGISLAMAMLPEELPVMLTVFFALGAWRIAKMKVLTRHMNAVEALGAVQVLCTDKTGTLTENRMTLRRLVTAEIDIDLDDAPAVLPEAVHALIEFGILASPREPFDPMEKAFVALGRSALQNTEHLHPNWRQAVAFPLTPELLAVTHAWIGDEAGRLVVATKGAPAAVFDLCHLDAKTMAALRVKADALAASGLRVLGVARSTGPVVAPPTHAHEVAFSFLGLVGLEDPLRDDVKGAIAQCQQAGVKVLMITGDHKETARAIATQAGITAGEVLLGRELDGLDDAALGSACVVARALPAHKLRIVKALQRTGLVVAMTGDGVNDAPALKAADIGIAMGKRGTDVARQAASLVLVDDTFSSLVAAIAGGRRIFDNLRKATGYIIAVHLPLAGLSLLPALLGWAVMLSPVHVVFLQLIVDPTCAVLFELEPAEPDVMRRPPRRRTTRLFAWRSVLFSVAQGLGALGGALFVVWSARAAGLSADAQRAQAFVCLIGGNLAILLASRSSTRPFFITLGRFNPALPIVFAAVSALLTTLFLVPPLRTLFGFASEPILALVYAFAYGAVPVLLLDLTKLCRAEFGLTRSGALPAA